MEKITVHIEVDGVELAPVVMGEGREDHYFPGDMKFYNMGYALTKDNAHAPYQYMISLTRKKTEKELEDEGDKK